MLIDLFRALQAGKELANAATWKKSQLWTSNLTILLGCAVSIAWRERMSLGDAESEFIRRASAAGSRSPLRPHPKRNGGVDELDAHRRGHQRARPQDLRQPFGGGPG